MVPVSALIVVTFRHAVRLYRPVMKMHSTANWRNARLVR